MMHHVNDYTRKKEGTSAIASTDQQKNRVVKNSVCVQNKSSSMIAVRCHNNVRSHSQFVMAWQPGEQNLCPRPRPRPRPRPAYPPICRSDEDGRLQQRSASHFTRNKFRCHFLSSPSRPPGRCGPVRLPLFLVIAMAMSVNGVTYMNSRQLCIFKI